MTATMAIATERSEASRDLFAKTASLPKIQTSTPKSSTSPTIGSMDRSKPIGRKSIFSETGLISPVETKPTENIKSTENTRPTENIRPTTPKPRRPGLHVRFLSKVEIHEAEQCDWKDDPVLITQTSGRTSPISLAFLRLSFMTFLLAFLIPALQTSTFFRAKLTPFGARAGPVPEPLSNAPEIEDVIVRRQSSPTDVCKRWSHQTALVNGTLYIYGGRAMADSSQTSDTWNNDFLKLDLSSNWEISSPTLKSLPQPSGPPAVANGFLWNSYTQLFLYGGEYSDTPATSPSPYALWKYDIPSSSWSSQPSPTTTAGDNSDGGNQAVQEAAEGAGVNIPELGRGYYFGGHLDGYTTSGWSQSIARVYLRSLLEFTFPGSTNPTISGDHTAGSSGLWRNITSGGLQDSAGFTERADGILVYVPGYGDDGIILGLAGGTNETFTQMNVIDVYDIAASTWYKQTTSGTTPKYRVNPCAVAVSAADGSSVSVYMYGGQNLVPYGDQIQYSDMWILTIPSFTWIEVDTNGQSVPPARAGHTCNVWNSQMVVVGGYVGQDLSCDSPGIYVFDTVNLTWSNDYKSLETNENSNPLNQQSSQQGNSSGLSGSYDYKVPGAVQSVIGGNSQGSATATTPSASASGGPFATGKPITYTVTVSGSTSVGTSTAKTTFTDSTGGTHTQTAVATVTSSPQGGDSSGSSGNGNSNGDKTTRNAAIAAGVVAGLLFLLASYLAWCLWVYKRHLALYKEHVSMAQRTSFDPPNKNLLFPVSTSDNSGGDSTRIQSDENSSLGRSGRRVQGYQQISSTPPPVPPLRKVESSTHGEDASVRRSASLSSTEELLGQGEPSFMGVVLNPRRTLRVVNN